MERSCSLAVLQSCGHLNVTTIERSNNSKTVSLDKQISHLPNTIYLAPQTAYLLEIYHQSKHQPWHKTRLVDGLIDSVIPEIIDSAEDIQFGI